MEFIFTSEFPESSLDEIVEHMRGPRLWTSSLQYPDFDDWLQKVHTELRKEDKRAVVCFSQGVVVGSMIYQPHKKLKGVLELKNLTVRPNERGRHIASFLLRNAEVEGLRDFSASLVVGDTKVSNLAMQLFLLRNGYQLQTVADLYKLKSGQDVVYQKQLIPKIHRL